MESLSTLLVAIGSFFAFLLAYQSEADGVELDVRLIRDGHLIVYHDYYLGRTSQGRGPVHHYTLEEMRSLDVGSWFGPAFRGLRPPTLEEVFEALPRDYLINVEKVL